MSATTHTVDPKFTYRDKRSGKDVVLYTGLLDAAHRAGLVGINTEVLQYPFEENGNTCIVKATVTIWRADAPLQSLHFNAIGDANPKNVGANIAPHFIRMAETRAKARALRDALNIGMVSVEELGGDEDAAPQQDTSQRAPARLSAPPAPRPAAAPTVAAGPPLLGTALLDIIRDDQADPKERRRALHNYFAGASSSADLNQRADAVASSGMPKTDRDAGYRFHLARLSTETIMEPASIAD